MAALWVAWCLTVIGWVVSPIISLLLNKLFSYLGFDISRELDDLEVITVPGLKRALRDATEKRMAQEIKKDDDLSMLRKLENRLKSALYDAEDILDLVEYHRTEKEAIGDKSIWQHLRGAVGACRAGWFGRWIKVSRKKLRRFAKILNHKFQAKLQQYAQRQNRKDLLAKLQQSLNQQINSESAADSQSPDASSTSSVAEFSIIEVEKGSAAQPPTSDASLNSLLEMIRCSSWSRHLDITSCFRSIISWTTNLVSAVVKMIIPCYKLILILISALSGFYSLLCMCRNWSYEVIGIQKDQSAVQCLVPVTERIRLRTQIKRLQSILKDSKKSDLFNQNTSSRTGKVTDKEGSSSSSKQKEIDDMYGSIEQKVFGRDKDRKRICRMLREEPDVYGASSSSSKPYRVIGIYGMAGSGKSTLAQYVCSYEKEKEKEKEKEMDNGKDVQGKDKRHFSPIMFIHVRKTFSVGDIFRDMLEQIKLSRPSNDKDLKSQEKDLEKDLKSLEPLPLIAAERIRTGRGLPCRVGSIFFFTVNQ